MELVVDNFAGGGGASVGIERAVGTVHIAINHDREAVAMHEANHPDTLHFQEDLTKVDPVHATGGRPVGLAWFSPDCKHFSKAKGGRPRDQRIRGLAWVAVDWVQRVRPRVLMLENVEEFEEWGPLDDDGHPIKSRKGETFLEFVGKLRAEGYWVEWRRMTASEYGTPTIRRRLFLVARRDGRQIVWPEQSHGEGLAPVRTAAECIDWSLPCPSIFERSRPLVEATMRRVARGIERFVLGDPQPFIVRTGHAWRDGREPGGWRGQSIEQPLATVCATNDKNLVVPFVSKFYGSSRHGASIKDPVPTVTGGGGHLGLCAAFVAKHFGGMVGTSIDSPYPTITQRGCQNQLVEAALEPGAKHSPRVRAFLSEYGSVVGDQQLDLPLGQSGAGKGARYRIVDIGMRMLQPEELFRAQGFPSEYDIWPQVGGKKISKTSSIRLCGNSVCPPVAEALVRANFRPERAVNI